MEDVIFKTGILLTLQISVINVHQIANNAMEILKLIAKSAILNFI